MSETTGGIEPSVKQYYGFEDDVIRVISEITPNPGFDCELERGDKESITITDFNNDQGTKLSPTFPRTWKKVFEALRVCPEYILHFRVFVQFKWKDIASIKFHANECPDGEPPYPYTYSIRVYHPGWMDGKFSEIHNQIDF